MNSQDFLEKYEAIIFDKKGRVNANLSRSKYFTEVSEKVNELTLNFPEHATIAERIVGIKKNIKHWPTCEVCDNYVKMSANGFTSFCGFKCSRAKGSSTFLKAQSTCIEKYGVKSNLVTAAQIEQRRLNGGIGLANIKTKEKAKHTIFKKYGVDNVFQAESIKEKIKNTHDDRYGGNFHTMKLGQKLKLLEDPNYCVELADKFCMSSISEILGVASNTVYKYFEKHGISKFNSQRSNQEIEMLEFLKTLTNEEIVCGDRHELGGLELDLFVPSKRIGIEMHGMYWHSEKAGASPSAHVKKYNLALSKNIRLIQIFESEWVTQQDIVKSRIASIFGKNEKLHARKCKIGHITHKEAANFFNKNHIQGSVNGSIYLGLFLNEDLVAAMSFSKTRFDKSADYELLRFCNKLNLTVVGGFQKLLKAFKTTHPNTSIVSYADKRWSQGNVYAKSGFQLVPESSPAYHYFYKSSFVLQNRIKFQKHRLSKILENFDPLLSEWDNMKAHGWNRIWDCGTTKWVLFS